MQLDKKHILEIDALPWENTKGLPGFIENLFAEKELLNDPEFTTNFSLSYVRFAYGAASKRHLEKWNHTILVVSGHGEVEIDDSKFTIQANTIVKIKAGTWHCFKNTGNTELIMLVIYDPPRPKAI